MGLFTQRPEQNEEWAGLPSEPLHPESTAERLTDAAPVDAGELGALALGGGSGASVRSIVIPVAPALETPEPHESGADDGP